MLNQVKHLLAAEINNAIIEETEKFMKYSKISKISEKKVFISNRLKEVGLIWLMLKMN